MHVPLGYCNAAVACEFLNFKGCGSVFPEARAECMTARVHYAVIRELHCVPHLARFLTHKARA